MACIADAQPEGKASESKAVEDATPIPALRASPFSDSDEGSGDDQDEGTAGNVPVSEIVVQCCICKADLGMPPHILAFDY